MYIYTWIMGINEERKIMICASFQFFLRTFPYCCSWEFNIVWVVTMDHRVWMCLFQWGGLPIYISSNYSVYNIKNRCYEQCSTNQFVRKELNGEIVRKSVTHSPVLIYTIFFSIFLLPNSFSYYSVNFAQLTLFT